MSEPRGCATCAHKRTCTLVASAPSASALAGRASDLRLPMPCAGELWQAETRRPQGSVRMFARFREQPAEQKPEILPEIGLDDFRP